MVKYSKSTVIKNCLLFPHFFNCTHRSIKSCMVQRVEQPRVCVCVCSLGFVTSLSCLFVAWLESPCRYLCAGWRVETMWSCMIRT